MSVAFQIECLTPLNLRSPPPSRGRTWKVKVVCPIISIFQVSILRRIDCDNTLAPGKGEGTKYPLGWGGGQLGLSSALAEALINASRAIKRLPSRGLGVFQISRGIGDGEGDRKNKYCKGMAFPQVHPGRKRLCFLAISRQDSRK